MTVDRSEYTAGLRALADLLDNNPDLKLPYGAGTGPEPTGRITFYFLGTEDAKADLARMARLIPGTVTKEARDNVLSVVGSLHGLHVEAVAYRDAVCERVVKATREVTRQVPAVDAIPARTVTETVEDVEWVCAPILRDEVTA